MDILGERIKELPPDLRLEAETFVEFLIERQRRKHRGKPKFGWSGALRDKYTFVELQHKVRDWRIGKR